MHRTIVELGPLAIRSYGVMLVIAFWLGIEMSSRIAKRRGLDPNRILDMGLVVLVASLAGSRLLYVVSHLSEYQYDKLSVLKIWEGGLTFYGGLIAGVGCGIAYLRWKKLPVLVVTDIVSPYIALGIAIARVGCFLNGCCFGKPTGLPWGCTFPPDSQAGWVERSALAGKAVHPTQIYESIACVGMFFLLRWLAKGGRATGTVFFSLLVLYGGWRFGIDFLRYYEPGMMIGGINLTWNQVVSLVMIASGLVMLLRPVGSGGRGRA
ncbi:MAG TPA: prolipoprotein diacylglyceryl transferase [bacterium]|nr:prolipoprotein diacylglyceryl transferase [bacterium]